MIIPIEKPKTNVKIELKIKRSFSFYIVTIEFIYVLIIGLKFESPTLLQNINKITNNFTNISVNFGLASYGTLSI